MPRPEQLQPIMRRTIELLNEKLTIEEIRRIAGAFRSVMWTVRDVDVTVYLVMDDTVPAIRYADSLDEEAQVQIGVDSVTLHDAALGRTSFGAAFVSGKLKVKGLNPPKLGMFVPLLKPFLASYAEAEEESRGQRQ